LLRPHREPPTNRSDGYAPYPGAVEAAFGWEVDFAQLTNKYVSDSSLPDAAHRYSPGHVTGVQKDLIRSMLDPEKVRTSCVERFNFVLAGQHHDSKGFNPDGEQDPSSEPQNQPKSPAHDVSHQTPQL
jgi:hypothetical protein